MGKRGPAGKPTSLRILHGDRKDRINLDEPVPSDGLPEPPVELSEEALGIWWYTLHELSVMKTVSPADRDALVCYCEAVVTHRKASALLARSGVIVKSGKGKTYVRNPLVQIQRDAAATVRNFAREFGLTPSARSEIQVGGASRGTHGGPERLLT